MGWDKAWREILRRREKGSAWLRDRDINFFDVQFALSGERCRKIVLADAMRARPCVLVQSRVIALTGLDNNLLRAVRRLVVRVARLWLTLLSVAALIFGPCRALVNACVRAKRSGQHHAPSVDKEREQGNADV